MKSARPVAGFLGPNAFIDFRVEIDYANEAVYFERGTPPGGFDMDLVGLALRPLEDGGYEVLGVAVKDGKPLVEGVEPGDLLFSVGDLSVNGATMGAVVDALRGVPGEIRTLALEREGVRFTIEAKVERCLGMNR
jgi:C-terminal processing protease CtpA/Prc